ncbi:MAG: reverse transcriptase family protein [Myxococcales bacterium]|nr:reverse transcriptase family protein [Myxococcales bacterium]
MHAATFCALLAEAFLAGDWQPADMARRGSAMIDAAGSQRRWMRRLAGRVAESLPRGEHLTPARVASFVERDLGFRRVWSTWLSSCRIRQRFWVHPTMGPSQLPLEAALPQVATAGQLADWLGVGVSELAGFADLQGRHLRASARSRRHYRRRWREPRSVAGSPRLLEAPKDRLRRLQRRILRGILSQVQVHDAAHGFVPGRSVHSCAARHACRPVLVRMDLSAFFTGIDGRRVAGLFEAMGIPRTVARVLAGLCTTATPADELAALAHTWWLRVLYARPHLPQGAPTSPALANLCAFRLDARLDAFARSKGWRYTRYADDLYLSGPDRPHRLVRMVHRIARQESFTVNARKTSIMRPGRAHRCLGLSVDRQPAVPRQLRERLEAILTNCVRHGPNGQNREGHPDFRRHLEGRVAWVTAACPRHGERFARLLEEIQWP